MVTFILVGQVVPLNSYFTSSWYSGVVLEVEAVIFMMAGPASGVGLGEAEICIGVATGLGLGDAVTGPTWYTSVEALMTGSLVEV